MARIRTIKPGFFRHEALFEAEKESGLPLRVAFAGLWTACDRDGRFEWKPRQLKLDALPYDDVDFSRVLDALTTRGFIVRYACAGIEYGHIPSWAKHQIVNNREAVSEIPEPTELSISAALTRAPRVPDAQQTRHDNYPGEQEGKGREQEWKGNGDARVDDASPSKPAPPEPECFTGKQKRACRWPEDAVVPDAWLELGRRRREAAGLPEIDLRLQAQLFQNHWASKSGADATKNDWEKTWVNWCLRSFDDRRAGKNSAATSHPFGVFGPVLEKERRREIAEAVEHEAD